MTTQEMLIEVIPTAFFVGVLAGIAIGWLWWKK